MIIAPPFAFFVVTLHRENIAFSVALLRTFRRETLQAVVQQDIYHNLTKPSMKMKSLFSMFAACVLSLTAVAQDWKAPAVPGENLSGLSSSTTVYLMRS